MQFDFQPGNIGLVKKMKNWIRPYVKPVDPSEEAMLVDQLLHINEKTYRIKEVFKLLDDAGLEYIESIHPELPDDPTELINSTYAKDKIKTLSPLEKLQVTELLLKQRAYVFAARKK